MKNELTKTSTVWNEIATLIEHDAATAAFGFQIFRSGMLQLGVTLCRIAEREDVRAEMDAVNAAMTKGRRWTAAGYTAHKVYEALTARGVQVLSKKHLQDCANAAIRAKELGTLESAQGSAEKRLAECKKVVSGRALLGWAKRSKPTEPEGVNVERVIAPSVPEEKSQSVFSVKEYGDEIIDTLEKSIKKLEALLGKKPINTPLLKCLDAKQTDRYRDIIHMGSVVFENFNLVFGERQRTNGKN